MYVTAVRGVTPSELPGHSNVLIQSFYIGTGCSPINTIYPPGYTAGKGSVIQKVKNTVKISIPDRLS